jgi:hypothetical protein
MGHFSSFEVRGKGLPRDARPCQFPETSTSYCLYTLRARLRGLKPGDLAMDKSSMERKNWPEEVNGKPAYYQLFARTNQWLLALQMRGVLVQFWLRNGDEESGGEATKLADEAVKKQAQYQDVVPTSSSFV